MGCATKVSRVRAPAVAGLFYPRDRNTLRAVVNDLLAQHAVRPEHAPKPKALIVPHALLGEFRLLPLTVGDATARDVGAALECVWGDEKAVIVVSSDLSHYLDYAKARAVDASTAQAILDCSTELDAEQACGYACINGLMHLARDRALEVRLLDLRNSGDTAGERSRVVGYGAFALYESRVGS